MAPSSDHLRWARRSRRWSHDGDTVALEGFTHLIPHAAGHEMIRQGRRDLHARADDARRRLRPADRGRLRRGLCSRGAATRASGRCTASATRSSTAGRSRWRSRSTATPAWPPATWPGRRACRSPCCAATSGTDLAEHTATIAPITCPFTGEVLTAVPALNPDVTVIHAQRADRHGNVQLWGIVGVQKEAVLAARRAIVTVEEIVDELDADGPAPWCCRRGSSTPCARCPAAPTPATPWATREPRQRLLPGLGRHRPRPRRVHRRGSTGTSAPLPTSPSTGAASGSARPVPSPGLTRPSRSSMAVATQTMTDEQRKSVALEYLKAFDNGGVTSTGGSDPRPVRRRRPGVLPEVGRGHRQGARSGSCSATSAARSERSSTTTPSSTGS